MKTLLNKNLKSETQIALIGSGNIATHLGLALKQAGYNIVQVFSRTKKSASQLSKLLVTDYTTDFKKIAQAQLYIICIKDDAIADIVKKIKFGDTLVVHTSGSIDVNVFKGCSKNNGVFYPLQTFSKNKKADFSLVPICVEANNNANKKTLVQIANSISNNVICLNSEQRKTVHLAAVFACNFSNHMYAIAEKILKEKSIPFNILMPLIQETANKVELNSPAKMQTGPAIRRDKKVMKQHLQMLKGKKKIKKIYGLLSKNISE